MPHRPLHCDGARFHSTANVVRYGEEMNFSQMCCVLTPLPSLAGTNTGDHMYVRASDACNQLAITQPDPNDGVTQAWSIRIDQVSAVVV